MFLVLILFQLLAPAEHPSVVLQKSCMKEFKKQKSGREICECYIKNLNQRLKAPQLEILAKQARGLSIRKELATVEGAMVLPDFSRDVKKECVRDPKWDVGPEDLGTPDEV